MSDEMPKDIAAELRVRAAMEQVEDSVFERAAIEIERLRAERDEARREIVESLHPDLRDSYVAAREWDCRKENTDER